MTQNKKYVAITGGIGSGKSFVIKSLEKKGYAVLSCDEVTKSLYKKQSVLRKLKTKFPLEIKGKIFFKADKGAIAKTVFNDKEKYEFLTEYLTQLTFDTVMKKAKKLNAPTVFIEVPLLFECKKENEFDSVVVIKRNLEDRIKSVIKRNNLLREQVLERIKAQFNYDEADLSKYIVINNNGSKEDLEEKISEMLLSL